MLLFGNPMAATTGSQLSNISVEREKWRKIFNAMKAIVQKHQTQIESLVDERTFLEDRINTLCDRFSEESKQFDRMIDQVNRNHKIRDMSAALQSAKADMLIGLKNREAYFYKIKSDNLSSELVDFRACIDHLSLKQSTCLTTNTGGREREMEEMKREYEKLLSDKGEEISALRGEKGFVWNQYKIMEADYTAKLKEKQKEAEKVETTLLHSLKQLTSEVAEKDATIIALRADVAKSEAAERRNRGGRIKKTPEVPPSTRLPSAVTAIKPFGVLHPCGFRRSASTERSSVQPRGSIPKRKKREDDDVPATPLFTSSFKVPKLKK